MQEFKRQNYALPLIWANDAGFISPQFQALGADAAYVTSREVWSVDITQTNTLAAQVNALYRERYGVDMNGNSARSFIGFYNTRRCHQSCSVNRTWRCEGRASSD